MEFTYAEAVALLDVFGGDEETLVTVTVGDEKAHSGPGLYAHVSDYPDEGSVFLGIEPEDHGDHPDRPDFNPEA